jgi:hypothetical protein
MTVHLGGVIKLVIHCFWDRRQMGAPIVEVAVAGGIARPDGRAACAPAAGRYYNGSRCVAQGGKMPPLLGSRLRSCVPADRVLIQPSFPRRRQSAVATACPSHLVHGVHEPPNP